MGADVTVPVTERRVRAMGSDAHLIVVGPAQGPLGVEELADRALARIADLEARWSRFLPDSEVSRLNREAGRPVPVSPDTVLLVRHAVDAWRTTGGGYDPTVLGAVLRAGYDRSFDELADVDAATDERRRLAAANDLFVGCTDIVVTDAAVALPAGTGFDPGGIGKGLAADLVATETMVAGASGVCVNLGGDLRVAGDSGAADGTAWTIAVEHPLVTEPLCLVGLSQGAVCTSTTLRRTWTVGGERRHHLIDPRTGEPSDSDLELVSVVSGQAWQAETLAKAVLLRGAERAFDVLEEGIEALTVDVDGVVRTTPGFSAFVGGVPLPTRITRHGGVS